jgi:hypothetical protein
MAYHNRRRSHEENNYPDTWKRTAGDRKRPLSVTRKQWRSRTWMKWGRIGK